MKLIAPILVPLFLLLASQSVACSVEEVETEIDCYAYCNQATECNGDVDAEECEQECEDTLDDCMEDDREAAQDQLDMCSEETCDDFTGCTIDAGLECFFGV